MLTWARSKHCERQRVPPTAELRMAHNPEVCLLARVSGRRSHPRRMCSVRNTQFYPVAASWPLWISFAQILYPQLLPLQGCPVTDPHVKFSPFLDFLSDLKKKQNKETPHLIKRQTSVGRSLSVCEVKAALASLNHVLDPHPLPP